MAGSWDTIETDVLVVGGGGAAARAALEARFAGADVLLAVKGAFGNIGIRGSGSTAGGVSDRGGIDYAGAPSIQGFRPGNRAMTPEEDYANIVQLGLGMTDRRLAQVMAEQGRETMRPLIEDWGAELFPRRWGLMSHGVPIMVTLARKTRRAGVRIRQNTIVVDLLTAGGRVAGAVAVDEQTGRILVIRAAAVILGTGGEGGMFRHRLSSDCTTGDGYAMAYRAGAELMNMEFKQVFPGTVHPTVNHFSAWFLVPGARVYNADGEEYIPRYLPDGICLQDVYEQRSSHGPFSARDSASRYFDVAAVVETKQGRANDRGALYVDLRDAEAGDPLAAPRRDYFYYRGIRYLDEPVEFNVCFHCSNGGVRVDENARSCVPGLYAAGETAAGMHGANRMAGHMLGASQIFGRLAGRHAAADAARGKPELPEAAAREGAARVLRLQERRRGVRPGRLIEAVRDLAWDNLLVHVNAETLAAARNGFAELRDEASSLDVRTPDDLVDAIELNQMLLVGEILTRAIEMRAESRGDQYREDYPRRDDENWNRVILVGLEGDEMTLTAHVIDPRWGENERPEDMAGIRWG